MARPLLYLVGIFKNEALSMRALLESVLPHIDGYTIVDTGSTDGTQEIIREVTAGVPGGLFEESFVDFATTRNRALELTAPYDPVFTLFLSGDEVLEGGEALRAYLEKQVEAEHGSYCTQIFGGPQSWFYPRVLRTSANWKYIGKVHESPVGPTGERLGPLVPNCSVIHTVSDPSRRAKRAKEFDLPVLTAIVDDESMPAVERAQAIYHLAEVYNTLAYEIAEATDNQPPGEGPYLTYQMMAMALYWRYGQIAEKQGEAHDFEKASFAYFRYYNTAEKIGLFGNAELLKRLALLAEVAPRIPELRFMMACHATQIDSREGLYLAMNAVKVAKAARENPSYIPTDGRIEWMSYRLAAACAKNLNKPKYEIKSYAERGILAGGPRETFEEYLSEVG